MRKRTGNIQQRGEFSFRIRYYDANGLRQAETITGTREDAERELAIRLGQLAAGIPVSSKPNTVLFGELANDVLTDYEVNGYVSLDDQEARFRLHLLPVFGMRKAAQITTSQIKSYILRRQAAGATNGTINRELELMRHTFNLAKKGNKLHVSPHVPKLREENARQGFFTREEIERLTRHLKRPLDSMVWFGFLTGWRIGEIKALLWSQIDFERGEIRLHISKNRKGRVFPMTEEVRLRLKLLKPKNPAPGQLVFKVGDFRKAWKTACNKAGLPCIVKPIVVNGTPHVKVLKALRTFHDLRRSFAREMDIQKVRRGAIKELAGWKTDSVFNRYNIVSESDLRDAVEQINEHRASVDPKAGRKSK